MERGCADSDEDQPREYFAHGSIRASRGPQRGARESHRHCREHPSRERELRHRARDHQCACNGNGFGSQQRATEGFSSAFPTRTLQRANEQCEGTDDDRAERDPS